MALQFHVVSPNLVPPLTARAASIPKQILMRPFFLFSLLVLGYVLCSAGRKLPSGTRKSFPTVPSGATLVHLAPDANTKATIPMLVNREYKKHQASSATHAIVVIHGQGRDFDNAWREVHDVVGDQV